MKTWQQWLESAPTAAAQAGIADYNKPRKCDHCGRMIPAGQKCMVCNDGQSDGKKVTSRVVVPDTSIFGRMTAKGNKPPAAK